MWLGCMWGGPGDGADHNGIAVRSAMHGREVQNLLGPTMVACDVWMVALKYPRIIHDLRRRAAKIGAELLSHRW